MTRHLLTGNGQPADSYLSESEKHYTEGGKSPVGFVKSFIEQGGPPESLEGELTGLNPFDRGVVLTIAYMMNPERAKESWRESARALLFATERPAI